MLLTRKPFTSVVASLFGFAMERYYNDGRREKMKTIFRTFPDGEQGLDYQFPLVSSSVCVASPFFLFTLKKTHLPCSRVFPSLVDFCSPAGLISLGIRMFTLHGTLFRITGLCLCASYVLAKLLKESTTFCHLLQIDGSTKKIGFLTCTKRNRV